MLKIKVLYKNKYGFLIEKIVKVDDIDSVYNLVDGEVMLISILNVNKLDDFTVY